MMSHEHETKSWVQEDVGDWREREREGDEKKREMGEEEEEEERGSTKGQ